MSRTKTYLFGFLICLCQLCHAATLVVLDVGEGQSVLLKDGADAILIDTGHAGAATSVLKALEKYKVKELKAIVLTHLHPDHSSGWFRLHEAFPEAITFYSGHNVAPLALDDVSRWVFEAITALPSYRKIGMGDSILVGRCTVDVMWPMNPTGPDLNANSLVLEVDCDGVNALLMADANATVEQALLKNGAVKEVGLLVVGHHGASDATSVGFLDKVNPEYSGISINSNNLRGYPAQAVLERLNLFGGHVLRTDIDGELCFRTNQNGRWNIC